MWLPLSVDSTLVSVKVLVMSRVMYSFNFGRNRHIAL